MSEANSMIGTDMRAHLSRLLGWWIDELARLVSPAGRRRPLWRGMLFCTEQGLDVYLRQGRATQLLGRIDTTTSMADAERIAAQLRNKGVTREVLVLRLPPEEVLATQLTLPAGVRDMLGLVVRNQLERVVPWPAEQALFAYEPIPAAPGEPQMKVELWVTGKAQVDHLLAETKALGLIPGIVDAAATPDAEPRFNLISHGEQDLARRGRTIARGLMAGAATAALASICGLAWTYDLGERQWAQEQTIQQALLAATAAARPRDAAVLRQRAHAIEQRNRTSSVSIALEALSRALPDDAYLERIELRNGVLAMSGKARSAAALIAPLEAVPYFEQLQFTAPTTRKEGEAREDFSLSLRVKPVLSLNAMRRP